MTNKEIVKENINLKLRIEKAIEYIDKYIIPYLEKKPNYDLCILLDILKEDEIK